MRFTDLYLVIILLTLKEITMYLNHTYFNEQSP